MDDNVTPLFGIVTGTSHHHRKPNTNTYIIQIIYNRETLAQDKLEAYKIILCFIYKSSFPLQSKSSKEIFHISISKDKAGIIHKFPSHNPLNP